MNRRLIGAPRARAARAGRASRAAAAASTKQVISEPLHTKIPRRRRRHRSRPEPVIPAEICAAEGRAESITTLVNRESILFDYFKLMKGQILSRCIIIDFDLIHK